MSPKESSLHILLSYPAAAVAAVCLAGAVILLIAGRRDFSRPVKAVLRVALAILLVYFLFLLWLTLGFGSSHPSAPPTPRQP